MKLAQIKKDFINGKTELSIQRTWEYASYIIHAIETNKPFVIYGTVPNNGLIPNLPLDGVVEVSCLVDAKGITPTYFGRLPAQCVALCDWNMRIYDLAVEACLKKSKTAAEQSLMLDPLTAAVCCPSEIRKMTEELFRAEKEFLPRF